MNGAPRLVRAHAHIPRLQSGLRSESKPRQIEPMCLGLRQGSDRWRTTQQQQRADMCFSACSLAPVRRATIFLKIRCRNLGYEAAFFDRTENIENCAFPTTRDHPQVAKRPYPAKCSTSVGSRCPPLFGAHAGRQHGPANDRAPHRERGAGHAAGEFGASQLSAAHRLCQSRLESLVCWVRPRPAWSLDARHTGWEPTGSARLFDGARIVRAIKIAPGLQSGSE